MSKINNKQAVKEFRAADPTRRASIMAKDLGISRERVRQILNALDLPTAFFIEPQICENDICQNKVPRYSKSKTCSRECFTAHRMGKFICDFCGKIKEMSKALIALQKSRYKHMYCSRSCRGKGYWENKRKHEIFA